jgi:hypothetical protein
MALLCAFCVGLYVGYHPCGLVLLGLQLVSPSGGLAPSLRQHRGSRTSGILQVEEFFAALRLIHLPSGSVGPIGVVVRMLELTLALVLLTPARNAVEGLAFLRLAFHAFVTSASRSLCILCGLCILRPLRA